jgi:hypothetical protein
MSLLRPPKKFLDSLRRLRVKIRLQGADDYVFGTRNGTPKSLANSYQGL